MQILVVVAIIQVRTLKTDVEKVSMSTAIVHGSGDPKRTGNSVCRCWCNLLKSFCNFY